ncbi:hypothetical protein EXIGLDRAFT_698775 [Exidia glandulosa HHB12029]|uniref:Uncharacterized protein n=1 Tax=Exidia glandulosa HHB12029 TaxID=1314781 RepID=A0A165E3N2_EXIGL|nr:hypothetical protein EXIGLDRAFT_698775 [Exidia glandulosa HHB12029]
MGWRLCHNSQHHSHNSQHHLAFFALPRRRTATRLNICLDSINGDAVGASSGHVWHVFHLADGVIQAVHRHDRRAITNLSRRPVQGRKSDHHRFVKAPRAVAPQSSIDAQHIPVLSTYVVLAVPVAVHYLQPTEWEEELIERIEDFKMSLRMSSSSSISQVGVSTHVRISPPNKNDVGASSDYVWRAVREEDGVAQTDHSHVGSLRSIRIRKISGIQDPPSEAHCPVTAQGSIDASHSPIPWTYVAPAVLVAVRDLRPPEWEGLLVQARYRKLLFRQIFGFHDENAFHAAAALEDASVAKGVLPRLAKYGTDHTRAEPAPGVSRFASTARFRTGTIPGRNSTHQRHCRQQRLILKRRPELLTTLNDPTDLFAHMPHSASRSTSAVSS